MIAPAFDAHGYPTPETIDRIVNWPAGEWDALLEFVRAAWHWPERATVSEGRDDVRGPVRVWRFSTGGWSGNEDLIGAMRANALFWAMCWYSSQRGGLYVFQTRRDLPREKAAAR